MKRKRTRFYQMPDFADIAYSYFKRRIRKKKSSECLLFGVTAKASICVGNARYLASRISYYLHYKIDPKELYVCHTCDNPLCVNPLHLFLGTNQDNMEDMRKKGRSGVGERNLRAKLTRKKVNRIRSLHLTGKYTQAELGERFGVGQCAISLIVKNRTWKHLLK